MPKSTSKITQLRIDAFKELGYNIDAKSGRSKDNPIVLKDAYDEVDYQYFAQFHCTVCGELMVKKHNKKPHIWKPQHLGCMARKYFTPIDYLKRIDPEKYELLKNASPEQWDNLSKELQQKRTADSWGRRSPEQNEEMNKKRLAHLPEDFEERRLEGIRRQLATETTEERSQKQKKARIDSIRTIISHCPNWDNLGFSEQKKYIDTHREERLQPLGQYPVPENINDELVRVLFDSSSSLTSEEKEKRAAKMRENISRRAAWITSMRNDWEQLSDKEIITYIEPYRKCAFTYDNISYNKKVYHLLISGWAWKSDEEKQKLADKITQTKRRRYGSACVTSGKYIYENVRFDSKDELAMYIYYKENGHQIERCTQVFDYEYKNRIRHYEPDFVIDGKITEFKGEQFFTYKEDGTRTMRDFYGHQNDELYEAKYNCMIQNNVDIVTDPTEFYKYINQKYGKDYLQQFKVKKD